MCYDVAQAFQRCDSTSRRSMAKPMSLIWFARLSVVVAAIFLPAALLNAALPTPEEAPKHPSLSGQLLVASPEMGDPRFYHAVILVVRHDQNGALGIVINRPVEDRSLASLLEALGEKDTGVVGSVRIFAGGPVQPEIGFVLHSADYHRPETVDIDGRVAVTSSPQVLRDIGNAQPGRLAHGSRRRKADFRRGPGRGLGRGGPSVA